MTNGQNNGHYFYHHLHFYWVFSLIIAKYFFVLNKIYENLIE